MEVGQGPNWGYSALKKKVSKILIKEKREEPMHGLTISDPEKYWFDLYKFDVTFILDTNAKNACRFSSSTK
jgi:hypothetical protein